MSLLEHKIQKIKAEIEYIKAQTAIIENESSKNLMDKIKKWIGVVLSIISVFAATWTLIFPINNYLTERKSALKFALNSTMVDLVDSLKYSDENTSNRCILLLSYYERNSLPILIYKLVRINEVDDELVFTNITKVISNIYIKDHKAVINILDDQLALHTESLKNSKKKHVYDINAINNLFEVYYKLPLKKNTQRIIQRF